jgi:hypothetical protein
MDNINYLLNKDIVKFLNEHCDTTYVSKLQCIAEVNRVIRTPYYEECLEGFQAMDPYNKLQVDETYTNHLLQLHTFIETEKNELIQFLSNTSSDTDMVSQIREKIQQFHDKKDKLCETTLHYLEYMLENQECMKL